MWVRGTGHQSLIRLWQNKLFHHLWEQNMRFDTVKTEAPSVPEILHITVVVKHPQRCLCSCFIPRVFFTDTWTVRLAGVADKTLLKERVRGANPSFCPANVQGLKAKKPQRIKNQHSDPEPLAEGEDLGSQPGWVCQGGGSQDPALHQEGLFKVICPDW